MTYWSQWRTAFEDHVEHANPQYEKFTKSHSVLGVLTRSSIHALIETLKREPVANRQGWLREVRGHLQSIQRSSDGTYRNKANKYKDALYHLVQTLGIAQEFSPGSVTTTRTCLFTRGAVPATFAPVVLDHTQHPPAYWHAAVGPNVTRMVVPSSFRNHIPEDSVARGLVDGIAVIHVCTAQNPLALHAACEREFDGWRTIDHMNSVLRVARRARVPVALLTINNLAPYEPLTEAHGYPYASTYSVPLNNPGGPHCGWHNPHFRTWISQKRHVLVMGYDGSICVDANLFGCPETVDRQFGVGPDVGRTYQPYDAHVAPRYRAAKPLVSVVNIETSRALLATGEKLDPRGYQGEYGPLHGL